MSDTLKDNFANGQVRALEKELKNLEAKIHELSLDNKRDYQVINDSTFDYLSGKYIKLEKVTEEKLYKIDNIVVNKIDSLQDLQETIESKNKENDDKISQLSQLISILDKKMKHDIETDDSILRKVKNLSLEEAISFLISESTDGKYERDSLKLKQRYEAKENSLTLNSDLIELAYKIEGDKKSSEFDKFKSIIKMRVEGVELQLSECKKQGDQYKINSLETEVKSLKEENSDLKKKLDRFEIQLENLMGKLAKEE